MLRLPRFARVRAVTSAFDETLWRKIISVPPPPKSVREPKKARKQEEEERNWVNDLLKNNFGF